MNKALYGRRKAGRAWVEHLAGLRRRFGSKSSNIAKQFFRRIDGMLVAEVHMDHWHGACGERELMLLAEALRSVSKSKHARVFSFGEGVAYTHSRRHRRLTPEGCYMNVNVAFVEVCSKVLGCSELGLSESSDRNDEGVAESEETWHQELEREKANVYRQCLGALLSVTQARGDLACAVRLPAQGVAKPLESSWKRRKRLVGCPYGTREL